MHNIIYIVGILLVVVCVTLIISLPLATIGLLLLAFANIFVDVSITYFHCVISGAMFLFLFRLIKS